MKFVLFALAGATLASIALFATGAESETDRRKFDYWASPDPFLHMSRVTAGLPPRRTITKDNLGPRLR
jgi:hypothetical protein